MIKRPRAGKSGLKSYLLAVNPTGQLTREFAITKSQVSLGSDRRNDLVIPDPTISRRHAKITFQRGRHEVVDLGSSNGTFLNSRQIKTPMRLKDGAELRFGNRKFVFSLAPLTPLPVRSMRRASSLRLGVEVALAALVVGFAATQYVLYRHYRGENAHVSAHRTAPATQTPTKARTTSD